MLETQPLCSYLPDPPPQGAMSVALRKPQHPEPVVPRVARCAVKPESIRLLRDGVWIAEGQYPEVCPWERMAEVCSRAGGSTPLSSVLDAGDKCHLLTSAKQWKFSRSKDDVVNGFCRTVFCFFYSPPNASPSAEFMEQKLPGCTETTPLCV